MIFTFDEMADAWRRGLTLAAEHWLYSCYLGLEIASHLSSLASGHA
jgi:hypothetical protein